MRIGLDSLGARIDAGFPEMVPGAGLEPARLAAGDFESPESTNFTTRAVFVKTIIIAHYWGDLPGTQDAIGKTPSLGGSKLRSSVGNASPWSFPE